MVADSQATRFPCPHFEVVVLVIICSYSIFKNNLEDKKGGRGGRQMSLFMKLFFTEYLTYCFSVGCFWVIFISNNTFYENNGVRFPILSTHLYLHPVGCVCVCVCACACGGGWVGVSYNLPVALLGKQTASLCSWVFIHAHHPL